MGLLTSLATRGGTAAARKILQLEDERTRQLARLERAVNALLAAPYHAGIEHVTVMIRPDTSPSSAARHLRQAEECFTTAFANFKDVDPLQSAWSAVHLVVISLADGRRGEGLHWAERAQERAQEALKQLRQAVQDSVDGRKGRLKLTSEDVEAGVWMGGSGAVGLGAAAAGVTIASGGLAWVAVGAGFGATFAVAKGVELYRAHQSKAGKARVEALSDFVDDVDDLIMLLRSPMAEP